MSLPHLFRPHQAPRWIKSIFSAFSICTLGSGLHHSLSPSLLSLAASDLHSPFHSPGLVVMHGLPAGGGGGMLPCYDFNSSSAIYKSGHQALQSPRGVGTLSKRTSPSVCAATTTLCVSVCAQSCPTLCDPRDCGPPGFSVRGISRARILE